VLIEQQKRDARVRFRHPIRVVTLDGEPRVIRTLTANVSRHGLFLRMPEPLADGTKVALSLEAGGRALALAQAEVVWGRKAHQPGCGVQFTEFLHPRGKELVDYLVENLDQGKLLTLRTKKPVWRRTPVVAMFVAIALLPVGFALWNSLSPTGERVGVRGEPELAVVSPPPPIVVAEPVVPEPLPGLTDELADAAAHAKADAVPDEGTGTEELAETETGLSEPVEDGPSAEVAAAPEEVNAAPVEAEAVAKASPEVTKAAPGLSEPVEDRPTEKPMIAAAPLPNPLPAAQGEGERRLDRPLPDPLPRVGEGVRAQGEGNVRLPTGASPKLAWHFTGTELRLEPSLSAGVQVSRAFVLNGPPRAVFDLTGGTPAKSLKVPASTPFASGVRLGKQGTGTRIVVDLERAPKRSKLEDGALVLSF
jgi:hypothetical protein